MLVKANSTTDCKECQNVVSYCLGGANIYPREGYWRSANDTDNFIECLNPLACLGGISPVYNLTGNCAEGYSGVLCSDCSIGYSRTGNYECTICPDQTMNILRLVGLAFIAIFGIAFIVKSTLASATEKKNYLSVYIRILLNHMQLVILTASFNLRWPDLVLDVLNLSEPVAEVGA